MGMEETMITKEENKLDFYTGDNDFTIPEKVTPDTALESLNLNWREKDLPERVRTKHVHRLHPYLRKFIPQLVEIFLRKYFKPGQVVLDPFVGSGTTLVQANELGVNSIGYDISAFNVLLSKAKTVKYDINKVNLEIYDILEKVKACTQTDHGQLSLIASQQIKNIYCLPEDANNYLQQWFAPQALYELLTYRKLIEIGNYEYKNLLKIILSRSARSARLTTHTEGVVQRHVNRKTCRRSSGFFESVYIWRKP